MHTLSVIVYGGGDLFVEYFNAIATAMGTSTFKTLFNMAVLLSGATAIFSAVFKRDFLTCVRWFAGYYLVFAIIFTPKVSIQVIDRTNVGKPYNVVDNVPLGLGVVAHLSTVVGDSLTKMVDKIFSMPDDLRYSKTGMMMASKMVLASRQFKITDSVLNGNMNRFMVQCVYWPILLGHYTMEDLVEAPNLWDFITQRASPARAFVYNKKITVCKAGVGPLGEDLRKHMDQICMRHSKRFFSSAKTPLDAKAELLKYLPISYGYLLKTSSSATDILQQNIVANAIVDGTLHFGIRNNSQNAVTTYTTTKAQAQKRLSQDTVGFLAGYWLPIMKSVFEAILYGCFIFIVLLGIFPFGATVLKNYVYTLFWLQAWAPLYAIINLICSYYARVQSVGVSSGDFVLKNLSGFMQVNHDMASLAGYLTISVPFIAAGLARGMAGTMTHLSQYMGGLSQSVGTQAAAEAVSGNISMGITGMRNNSSFNMSSYQQDLRGRMSSGVSHQLPSGESINFMPDGGVAVDRRGTISDLGVDINLARSIQSSATKQADYSYNTAQSESVAANENYSAGMRNLYELSEHVGSSKSSGDAWVFSESSNENAALNNVKDLTQQFSDQHSISYDHAKEILTRANGSLGVDGSVSSPGGSIGGASVGAKAGMGLEGIVQDNNRASEQKIYNHAEDFVKKSGYSESIDVAQRAARDHSYHSNNEQGARLLDSTAGHFERADSFSKSASAHYEQAKSYRNVASYAQDNGVSINVNASQDFLKYISNQPAPNASGRIGVMGAIGELQRPEMAKIMADNFAHDYAKKHLSDWGKGVSSHVPHSGHEVKQAYQNQAESISGKASINLQEQMTIDKGSIDLLDKQKGLSRDATLSTFAQSMVGDKMLRNKVELQQSKDQMITTEETKEQKFKGEAVMAKQERGHGVIGDSIKSAASYFPLGIGKGVKSPKERIREKIDDE